MALPCQAHSQALINDNLQHVTFLNDRLCSSLEEGYGRLQVPLGLGLLPGHVKSEAEIHAQLSLEPVDLYQQPHRTYLSLVTFDN